MCKRLEEGGWRIQKIIAVEDYNYSTENFTKHQYIGLKGKTDLNWFNLIDIFFIKSKRNFWLNLNYKFTIDECVMYKGKNKTFDFFLN